MAGKPSAEFVYHMEDMLEVYHRPRSPALPQAELLLVGRLPWDLVSWRGDPGASRCPMSRHQNDPLRLLMANEQGVGPPEPLAQRSRRPGRARPRPAAPC